MTMQAKKALKKMTEQELIEQFGIKIGNEEWKEILRYYFYWKEETERFVASFERRKINIPVEYQESLEMQRTFFSALSSVHEYKYGTKLADTDLLVNHNPFWIINLEDASYQVSYDGIKLEKGNASFQEFMEFLAFGIAKKQWTVEAAIFHTVSKCRVKNLLEAR